MQNGKEGNRLLLERISFHLDEALRFTDQLDLSGLPTLGQEEWDHRIKTCKDALEFIKDSLQKLDNILE